MAFDPSTLIGRLHPLCNREWIEVEVAARLLAENDGACEPTHLSPTWLAFIEMPTGLAFVLWLMHRRREPAVTLDQCRELSMAGDREKLLELILQINGLVREENSVAIGVPGGLREAWSWSRFHRCCRLLLGWSPAEVNRLTWPETVALVNELSPVEATDAGGLRQIVAEYRAVKASGNAHAGEAIGRTGSLLVRGRPAVVNLPNLTAMEQRANGRERRGDPSEVHQAIEDLLVELRQSQREHADLLGQIVRRLDGGMIVVR